MDGGRGFSTLKIHRLGKFCTYLLPDPYTWYEKTCFLYYFEQAYFSVASDSHLGNCNSGSVLKLNLTNREGKTGVKHFRA